MNKRFSFPSGGGLMGDAMRRHDWCASQLGPLDEWPEPLRNALNLLLNSPESMYLVWGPEHTFFFNDAYIPILGPRFEGALGHSLPVLWADAWEAVRPSLEAALEGEASRFVDVPIAMNRYGADEQTWWSYSYSPIYDGARVAGVFCFTTETTARVLAQQKLAAEAASLESAVDERTRALHAAEEALRQAQKMEAIGQLTGGLAHDFNNLLAGISGSLDLLKLRLARGQYEDAERYIGIARNATQRAAALTHRLLAFSRRQNLAPEVADTNRIVGGMAELIRRTVGPAVTLDIVSGPALWPVFVDPPQLENALLNLCINARDALPDGGRIEVATTNRHFDRNAARELELKEGDYVLLRVADDGTGMAPDVIAKVFEPFFTTKPIGQGTGLGLSMIYGFVQQSGGQVKIRSAPGAGTEVCLYLPRHVGAGMLPAARAPEPAAPSGGRGEAILVVDDEADVRALILEGVQGTGYTAIEAGGAVDTLALLRSPLHIDLLVTDVGLPGGLNGRQLADAARELRPGLPVLFITGYAESSLLERQQPEERIDILVKPFSFDALTRQIQKMLAPGGTA